MADKKYAAFISYRHGGVDEDCAKLLHQSIESYRLPSQLAKKLGKKKVGRVFRDVDELPTSDSLFNNIEVALNDSEFLIVMCTPRLKESKWCLRELEIFSEKNGADKILAVLAEGEPEDSFPDILTHRMVDGVMTEVEPLAADLRGENNAQRKKKLKTERLRILASILDCEYDQLYQRERRRQTKRITAVVSGVFAIIVCFAAVMVRENFKLQSQVKQTQEAQSYLLTQYSETAYSADNRTTAALLALEGLPEDLGDSRPYVAESMAALTNALQIYDYQSGYTADRAVNTQTMDSAQISADGKYMVYVDLDDWDIYNAHIYNIESDKTEVSFEVNPDFCGHQTAGTKTRFFGEHFVAIAGKDGIVVADTDTMKKVWSGAGSTEIDVSKDGTVIGAFDGINNTAAFYKPDGTELSSFSTDAGQLADGGISPDGKYCAIIENDDENGESKLYILDTATGEIAAQKDNSTFEVSKNEHNWSGDTFIFRFGDKANSCEKYGYYNAKDKKFTECEKLEASEIVYLDEEKGIFFASTESKIAEYNLKTGEQLYSYSASGQISDVCVVDEKDMKFELAIDDGSLEYVDYEQSPYLISQLKGGGESFTKIVSGGDYLAGYLINSYKVRLYRFNDRTTDKIGVMTRRPNEILSTVSHEGKSFCMNTSVNSYILNTDTMNVVTIPSPTSYLILGNENTVVNDNYDGTLTYINANDGENRASTPDECTYMADASYKFDEENNKLDCYSYDTGEIVKSYDLPENCVEANIINGGLLCSVQKDDEKDVLMTYTKDGKEYINARVEERFDFDTGIVYRKTNSDEFIVFDVLNNKEVTKYAYGNIDWMKRTYDNKYLFISTSDKGAYVIDMDNGEIILTITDSSTIYDITSYENSKYFSMLYLSDSGSTKLYLYEKDNPLSPVAKINGGLTTNKNDEVLIYDGEKNIYAAPIVDKETIYKQGKDFVGGATLDERQKGEYHCK